MERAPGKVMETQTKEAPAARGPCLLSLPGTQPSFRPWSQEEGSWKPTPFLP